MNKFTTLGLTKFLVFVFVFLKPSLSHAEGDLQYAGVNSCKLCHSQKSSGDQYGIWRNTAHAHAYDTLLTPKAKEIAAKKGISAPEKSPECLQCHSTAFGLSKERVASNLKDEDGVQCESCHGPGKKYMARETMKNREKAIAAGLIIPNEQNCIKCHNSQGPTWDPAKGFDYAKALEQIKHPDPKLKK